jgi:hypothetical protein
MEVNDQIRTPAALPTEAKHPRYSLDGGWEVVTANLDDMKKYGTRTPSPHASSLQPFAIPLFYEKKLRKVQNFSGRSNFHMCGTKTGLVSMEKLQMSCLRRELNFVPSLQLSPQRKKGKMKRNNEKRKKMQIRTVCI